MKLFHAAVRIIIGTHEAADELIIEYLNAFPRLLGVLLCVTAAGAAEQEQGPADVVAQAASELQSRLSGQQEFYAANTAELYALVDDVLLPNFDVEYAGKLVLGKTHWRAADEGQRERFIEVFYSFLIKTYAKGVLEFDQDKLLILPDVSFSKSGSKALVRTELVVDAGDNVQVNYAVRSVDSGLENIRCAHRRCFVYSELSQSVRR